MKPPLPVIELSTSLVFFVLRKKRRCDQRKVVTQRQLQYAIIVGCLVIWPDVTELMLVVEGATRFV